MKTSFQNTIRRSVAELIVIGIGIGVGMCGGIAAGVRAAESGLDAKDKENEREAAAKLPLSSVILYTSGVGYFERDGEVSGEARVDLQFKVEDINDLLKSMVVQDFNGGRVSTVTYGSRDPIAKTLKSFAIDLTANPTLGQLLNQIRGEQVEISWPAEMRGVLLGVEKKTQPAGENKTVEVEYLNLLTSGGLQSVPLEQVRRIQLVNPQLNRELQQALEVLATSHDTQKKTVRVGFSGEGKRSVRISYIEATPVWKTSYRLVLDEKEKPFLQGWAIVENTSDEDWNKVRLALVSGRPISFRMDLYQPLYVTRPEVQPELYSSLAPPVYADSLARMEESGVPPAKAAELKEAVNGPRAAVRYGLRAESMVVAGAQGGSAPAYRRGTITNQGVEAAAAGQETGELFEYSISTPVTLARQKSAMLPILSQTVEGTNVSIYNATVQAKHPLSGFRLKNSSSLYLMQGPITVFDAGAYAGDARMNDLAPGQDRLISYALDLKTEVDSQHNPPRDDIVSVQIKKGVLVVNRKSEMTTTYRVRNHDKKKKNLLIEHPLQSDWKLVAPAVPAEKTSDHYRFQLPVNADSSAKLDVVEEREYPQEIQLLSYDSNAIGFYLRSRHISPAVKAALTKVISMRNELSRKQSDEQQRQQRVQEIGQDQARVRENMKNLSQTSTLYTRYVTQLDQQETEMEQLHKQISELRTSIAKLQQEINDYLVNLTVE